MLMDVKRRKQKLIAEINITPFTDVILVLLVIFMITAPLISQSSIKVNLPQAAKAEASEEKKPIYITITEEGIVYLDNELVTKKELKNKIYSVHENNPEGAVILRADKFVRFKDIISVLDVLSDFGIKNLNIAATVEH
jgi:TonB system transport protein ExbD (group 2)